MSVYSTERTGAAIRKLRTAKGWTLAQLSDACGVPLATLSRVELGQTPLNYDKLVRLCRALEVDLQGLVTRQADASTVPIGRRSVIRAGEGEAGAYGPHTARFAAAELLDKPFIPMILDITVTSLEGHGPLRVLPGEAYLLVLAGVAVLCGDAYAPRELATGDAVWFDGRGGYALLAPGGEAKVLLVAASADSQF